LMLPDVGLINVQTMRMLVVFPAPLGPIKPKISPGLMLKLTPSTALICPNCFVNVFACTAKLKVSPSIASLMGCLLF
jgi:hypothetical protein